MGSTVDIGGTDNVIARFRQVTDGQKLRSQSRRGRYSSRSAFEGGDPLFENGGGRIGQAGIDIAELAQRKAVGTILRIVEHIGCSLVNGYGTGTGNRIGYLSGVDLQRVKAVIFLAHGFID